VIRRILKILGILILVVAAVLIAAAVWPVSTKGLDSNPQPVAGFAAATKAFAAVRKQEKQDSVIPTCRSRLLTHGTKTARVMVLVHGLTNCPAQWAEFGEEIYDRGWNVLILRLPDHGIGDVETDTPGGAGHLGDLSAGKLARYGDQAVDIAAGLGERVSVMGLSLGGTVTAWIAQERKDVDRAIVIAPGFAMKGLPYAVSWLAANLLGHLPNITINGASKVHYEYQGWSTQGIADTFKLGKKVAQDAESEPPGTRSIVVFLNPNDDTISNPRAEHVAGDWKGKGARVEMVWLPSTPKLEHDIIDPHQPWARPAFVYPRLIALAEAPGSQPAG
jgi:alpha-beta hydrolase superfamily lysophospholipase